MEHSSKPFDLPGNLKGRYYNYHHLTHDEIKAQIHGSNLYRVLQLFLYSRPGIYVHTV